MLQKDSSATFGERNQKAIELVETIKTELTDIENYIRQKCIREETERLLCENAKLKEELQNWQSKVLHLEIQNGIPQVHLPTGDNATTIKQNEVSLATDEPKDVEPEVKPIKQSKEKLVKKDKEATKKKEKPVKTAAEKEDIKDVNVSRLDLRVGRIVSVEKHPDADSLYVEKVDLGEKEPRTVVSGLVKFVPLEQMQNRLVLVLCNLKPVKMRGVTSEAMVMCASTPDKVEILNPPPSAVPGDRVVCDDFPGEPDAILNPKKKIFEQVAPDLKTNDECVATYKDAPLKVAEKGVVRSETLIGVQIK